MINFDVNLLTAYYQAKYGGSAALGGGVTGTGGGAVKKDPTPPWSAQSTAPQMTDLVRGVLAGRNFIDENAAKLDVASASPDYKRLFGLYQGLTALQGIADQATGAGVGDARRNQLNARFAAGMQEVAAFLDRSSFTGFQLAQGTAGAKLQSTGGVKRETDTYTTGVLASGSLNTEVPAFTGPAVFSLDSTFYPANGAPVVTTVNFDLAEMGATPRTLPNVVIYMNDKMKTAGLMTRFGVQTTPGVERTTKVGDQTVSLGMGPDTFALQIKGISTEHLAFSAPTSAPSVYVGESEGAPGGLTVDSRLFKFQTDPAGGATTAADGRIFGKALDPSIQAVKSSAIASDGSLYVLAEVDGTVDGQTIKGARDVVLQKYDSAGNLTYTRTLGAARDASGYALTVSADGQKVAIAGSVTGGLDAGDAGFVDPKLSDSFVAIFDADGQQLWSQRRGASLSDDNVNSLAFAADGSLLVGGTTGSAMFGAVPVGGQDSYVQRIAPTAPGATEPYATNFMLQYGTAGFDKNAGMAVNGNTLYVAGVESGNAVVRSYTLQATGAPVLAATRDLGPLNGGAIAGLSIAADGSVIVAGSTHNGTLGVGQVTTAYTTGQAAFVAKLSPDLAASGQEKLTYYSAGGANTTATAVSMAGGKVYIAGQTTAPLPPGSTSAFDGYAAGIDPDTGAVSWSQTIRGADRMSAPTSIAVDTTGASVLDRLGLPRGTIDYTGSQQIVANTSVRAGDQFYVRTGKGSAIAVTIEAADTLQSLAAKISRATGFNARVQVFHDGDYDRLRITPNLLNTTIEIEGGKTGKDALVALGIPEGLVTTATDKNTKDSVKANYSLGLSSTLNLTSTGEAKKASAMLLTAMSAVKSIYRDMTTTPASKAANGPVPAYLTNQIANYQAALDRLTGG